MRRCADYHTTLTAQSLTSCKNVHGAMRPKTAQLMAFRNTKINNVAAHEIGMRCASRRCVAPKFAESNAAMRYEKLRCAIVRIKRLQITTPDPT